MPSHAISKRILSWIPPVEIDVNVINQVTLLSSLPFIWPHVALMPDCHLGKGASVGSCIPTVGAVIPAAVGVDIGCGMVASKTDMDRSDLPDDLGVIRRAIETTIPLSAGRYNQKYFNCMTQTEVRELEDMAEDRLPFYDKTSPNWRMQLGSLGSGNHFIEIVLDENEAVWVFLHSGSRGIGNRLAQHHIGIAGDLMKTFFIQLEDRDLAYLPEGTPEFDDYIRDLQWAQHFALLNRREMCRRVLQVLTEACGDLSVTREIECHHNFTQKEQHYGKNIWVSRKGAISARLGQEGLIPGSMGTSSYVVRGKGNKVALCTAPHGAGRRMSRTRAKATFNMDDFDRDMEGIEVRRSAEFLDELPGAYKDIDTVMEQSRDLVEVEHVFRQLVNVKGD